MLFNCTTEKARKDFSVAWRQLYDGTDLFRRPLRNKKEKTLRGDNFDQSDRPSVLSVPDQVSASNPFSAFS